MSTEECKLCLVDSTPWEYIKWLDGHICESCAYLDEKTLLLIIFQKVHKLERLISPSVSTPLRPHDEEYTCEHSGVTFPVKQK